MKKAKVLTVLLAVVLLLSNVPAMAASPATFEVETVTARAGETVEVDIAVKNSPGITSTKLRVAFDEALTLQSVAYGTAITGSFVQPQKITSPVILNWANGLQDFSGDYLFATLTFTVAQDASAGLHEVSVTYDPDDVYNVAEDNMYFAVVNGGVEVAEESEEEENDCTVDDGSGNMTHYADLNEAIKAAAALENGGTVTLQSDMTVEGVVVPTGVTLDLGDATLTADYFIGLNGGTLTATPNAGKLAVDKGSLILPEEGYKNVSGQYILPVWDPEQSCYVFSLFVVNTNNAERGLFIDEENETIRFQFKHQATGAINQNLLNDGSSDNALKVIVRLVWESENGEAYQDFVYNDGFVKKVAVGENGVSYDYSFTLSGYSAMNIKLDTLKVVGMIITDSGAVASGTVWTAEMAK